MFLKNHWYVAAEPHEITRVPFARTICNQPVVFWRAEDGQPVAFEDRCCHRRMPLRKGTVDGDRLRCHYHGPGVRPFGRLRARVRPERRPARRAGPDLSGDRKVQVDLDLARRPGRGRRGGRYPLPVARERRLGRQGDLFSRQRRLSAADRQSARPIAPGFRSRLDHWHPGDRRTGQYPHSQDRGDGDGSRAG